MRPVVLLADPFAQGSRVNLEEADGQRKNSSLVEEPLDETVQQLRKYLDGKHQVLDLGAIGLFRTYVVTPVSDDFLFSTLQYAVPGGKEGKQAAEAWLKQPHPIADYWKSRNADAMNSPFKWAGSTVDFAALKSNVQDASNAITGLGVPRQRDTLIVLDLSAAKNPITGGGVGGYAYRRSHAIEADGGAMVTPFGVELLVHEWAHKQFFNLPQHVTRYVADWFKTNVAENPSIKNAERIPHSARDYAVSRAWEGFRDSWEKWEGVAPDEYLAFKARTAKTPHGDTAPLFDALLKPGRTIIGKLRKALSVADAKRAGMPVSDGAKSIRAGATVQAFSSRAMHPDSYTAVRMKGGVMQPDETLLVTAEMLRASLEIDVAASAKESKLDADRLTYRIQQMQIAPEPGDDRTDRFFTRESIVFGSLDDAARAAADFLNSRGVPARPHDLFPTNRHEQFTSDWIEAAEQQGDKFDAEKTFRVLFWKYVVWEFTEKPGAGVEHRLSAPDGRLLRELAATLKITPSSYAAANVDELWAELIAHMALRPADVPKPLKMLLRDAMQGKTPGPGQRVKQDNTPKKFRKAASEALALLDVSPFLTEMDKHGNKRSHASRVRAYKKSGRMVAQTFATGASLGRSNAADAVIDYAREGDAAYSDDKPQTANPYRKGTPEHGGWGNGWFSAWKIDYRNGSDAARRGRTRASNPHDKGTNAHAAWIEGWDDNAEADAREAESDMNEAGRRVIEIRQVPSYATVTRAISVALGRGSTSIRALQRVYATLTVFLDQARAGRLPGGWSGGGTMYKRGWALTNAEKALQEVTTRLEADGGMDFDVEFNPSMSESEAPTWVSDAAGFQPRDTPRTPRTPRSTVRDTAKVGMHVSIDGYEGRIIKINHRETTTSIVLTLSGGQRTRPFMFRDAVSESVALLDRSPFA